MNKNIDLTKILKNCPKGWKFYSSVWGEVKFNRIDEEDSSYPIVFITKYEGNMSITANGKYYKQFNGECTLFPSKDQRDWSKFTAPWLKKERFDPKTLQPYQKVLTRDYSDYVWKCDFFSHINEDGFCLYRCVVNSYTYCIPYNDDTKHLVGTTDEAPEYYRYWED